MSKTSPAQIMAEYEKGVEYNQRVGLYDTVETNENFYIGKCWEGVSAPDLEKPVIPLLKRAISQFIAMIVSDDISSQIAAREPGRERAMAALQRELDNIAEDEKLKAKNRLQLRNAAVDGDCCAYCWFDPDAETGQKVRGRARVEVVDNTGVLFGNPEDHDVQAQPYILLPMRELVEDLKAEAMANGVPEAEANLIAANEEPNAYNNKYSQGDLATAVIKLWRDPQTGTVWAAKVCGGAVVRPPWDTQYRLYPVAYMSWEAVRNSYHGASAVAGLIPNQIFINKMYALAMLYVKNMAFPKFAYDKTRLPNGISNKVGEAIAVAGDPSSMVFKPLVQADMSNQVFAVIDRILEHTKNLIGANDTVLGNARPDNASAIIALTKASTVPLEIQRLNFYQFVEDYLRVLIEIIATDYGVREIAGTGPDGQSVTERFDFSSIKGMDFRLNIDVGQSAYWSEVMQIQTVDNMWQMNIISDPIDYLENMPDGIVKNKNRLIEKYRQMKAEAEAGPVAPDSTAGAITPGPFAGGMGGQQPLAAASPQGVAGGEATPFPMDAGGEAQEIPPVSAETSPVDQGGYGAAEAGQPQAMSPEQLAQLLAMMRAGQARQ
jgi:hypothetical protein